jgi:uncharacterized protein (DUF302 family)
MLRLLLAMFLVMLASLPLMAADGLVHVESPYDVSQTADRLEQILTNKGMTIFNRINHSEAAQKVGVELRTTELLIFGNPKAGSPLMKCQQTAAIDLPQKALIWQDANRTVRITYNDPAYLQTRHDIQGCNKVLDKVSSILAKVTKAAVSQD